MDSIKQAGWSFCWTEWSVVSDAASAPFDKAGFFLSVRGGCEVVLWTTTIAPTTSSWRHIQSSVWIRMMVCSQDGFFCPGHMSQTWESLRGCSTFLTKGEKIKAARWFQFNRRTRDVLSTVSSLLMIITYIGMLDRWFDHVDASPLGRLVGSREAP